MRVCQDPRHHVFSLLFSLCLHFCLYCQYDTECVILHWISSLSHTDNITTARCDSTPELDFPHGCLSFWQTCMIICLQSTALICCHVMQWYSSIPERHLSVRIISDPLQTRALCLSILIHAFINVSQISGGWLIL